jgi:hypothetical protein
MRVPSGDHATPNTAPVWPVRVRWVPVVESHTRTVSSVLVVAMRVPSGDHATPVTASVWPVRA